MYSQNNPLPSGRLLEVCPQSHSFDVIAFGILIVLNYKMFNRGQSLLLFTIYCIMCLSNKGIQGMYLIQEKSDLSELD